MNEYWNETRWCTIAEIISRRWTGWWTGWGYGQVVTNNTPQYQKESFRDITWFIYLHLFHCVARHRIISPNSWKSLLADLVSVVRQCCIRITKRDIIALVYTVSSIVGRWLQAAVGSGLLISEPSKVPRMRDDICIQIITNRMTNPARMGWLWWKLDCLKRLRRARSFHSR